MVQMYKKSEHWDYFSSRIVSLLANKVLCDVTLISGDKKFPANRMLLSGCSEFFETMFTASFKVKDSHEVEIKGVEADVLDSLIKFCSTGALEINPENAEGLLRGAHFLQLPIARLICCEYIMEVLSPLNCIIFWMLAKELALKDFEARIFRYCLDHFRDIFNSTIQILSLEKFFEVVSNRDLNIQKEKDALNVVMDWIRYEPATRAQHINQLATCIDFNLVKQSDFSQHISLLRQFKNTQEFLFDIMNFYFSLPDFYNPMIPTSRNSTFAPISLSADGFQFYDKRTATWLPQNGCNLELIKCKKVLAAHVFNYNFYVVSQREGSNVIIEVFDLRNNSLVSTTETPYRSAAAAISFPMVYLVGPENSFCGFDLLKMKKIEFPLATSIFGEYPGVVVSGEELYVFGGETVESFWDFRPSRPGQRLEIRINESTQCFSFMNNTWRNCASMPFPVSDMGIAARNEKIFVLGGATAFDRNRDNPRIATSTQSFQCYDPITDTWSALSDLGRRCHSVKMCVWNQKLLATGNFSSTDKAVFTYDPESGVWEEIESLKNASSYLFVSSIDLF